MVYNLCLPIKKKSFSFIHSGFISELVVPVEAIGDVSLDFFGMMIILVLHTLINSVYLI